jgi:hypothetical protein
MIAPAGRLPPPGRSKGLNPEAVFGREIRELVVLVYLVSAGSPFCKEHDNFSQLFCLEKKTFSVFRYVTLRSINITYLDIITVIIIAARRFI